jgi:hypothetical protein
LFVHAKDVFVEAIAGTAILFDLARHLHQILGMKSTALLAWGPIHDNHAPHNVDDDADGVAVNLSRRVAVFSFWLVLGCERIKAPSDTRSAAGSAS